jgi:hypothetical protein
MVQHTTVRHAAALREGPSLRRPRREELAVFQLRVDLDDTEPRIWRRLNVRSDLTLDVLHQVLQDAFGWTDSHLHRFALGGGVWDDESEVFLCAYDVDYPEDVDDGVSTPEVDVRLDETMTEPGDRLAYVYDYGDNWELTLKLEKVLPAIPGTPAAACADGSLPAPPDDSRFAYLDGGLAAVVDDPAHFDPAEVNQRLARSWYTLWARGFHPRLLELASMLSWTDEGRVLGEQLAALPAEPVRPSDDELAAALRAHLWFLDRSADGGLGLTPAGYLRPALVEEVARILPQMGDWIGKANREEHTRPVADFRDRMSKQLGLLRKYKSTLRLTKAGGAVHGKPASLFGHLAARLRPDVERDRFEVDADLLVLAYAAVTPDGELPVDRIAAQLTDLDYRLDHDWFDGDRPIPGYYLSLYQKNAHDLLVNVSNEPVRPRHPSYISPTAAALAHAALVRSE